VVVAEDVTLQTIASKVLSSIFLGGGDFWHFHIVMMDLVPVALGPITFGLEPDLSSAPISAGAISEVSMVAALDWRKSRRVDGRQGIGSTIQKGLYVTYDLVAAIAPRRQKNVRHQPAYLVTRRANTDINVRDDLERCGDKMVESGHPQTAE